MNRFKSKLSLAASAAVLCTILLLGACNGCKKQTQRSFEGEPVPVNLMRFEQELFAIDTNNAAAGLGALHRRYGVFYISFAKDILNLAPDASDPLFIRALTMMIKHPPLRALQHTIDSTFGDLADLRQGLEKAMGIYKAQFDNVPVPAFITFLSEYALGNATFDTAVAIGLDMYMNGTEAKYYRALEFPDYMVRKQRAEYILPNTIKALASGRYEEQLYRDKHFIAMMLYEGKLRYFAKALLPGVADSLIFGYSAQQLKWCEDNEPEIWAHFIEKQLLYKNEPSQYIRYFNDGPFTSADGVPPESAPAIGAWTGFRIVNRYMNTHPEVSLQQLMNETDTEKILKGSNYRPEHD